MSIVAELSQLFENTPGYIAFVSGPNHRFEVANAAYRRLVGERPLIGRTVSDALPELGLTGHLSKLDEVYRTGEAFRAENVLVQFRDASGSMGQHYITFIYQPVMDSRGDVTGIFAQGVDVTREVAADDERRKAEARLEAFFHQSAVGIAETNLEGRFLRANQRYCQIVGRSEDQLRRLTIRDVTHPDDFAANDALLDGSAIGGSFAVDKRYVAPDGAIIWVHNSVTTITDHLGKPSSRMCVSIDISDRMAAEADRRRAEERQRLLITELNHRVKNMLTVVQGIAHKTLKSSSSPQEMISAFESRLHALGAAHDILTQESSTCASIKGIVTAALTPFCTEGRCFIDGLDFQLPSRVAVSLALAIHELATNAVKYGGLSNETGQVDVTWTVEDGVLGLIWQESGGPVVHQPERRGFGSRLIEQVLAAELSGSVEMFFEPSGLRCVVRASL